MVLLLQAPQLVPLPLRVVVHGVLLLLRSPDPVASLSSESSSIDDADYGAPVGSGATGIAAPAAGGGGEGNGGQPEPLSATAVSHALFYRWHR